VKWESLDPHTCNTCKGDPSRKSFIFTLKNPHHVPARKFALKAESENEAINCSSQWGPIFADLAVCDNCGKCDASEAFYFGSCYTNDTGLDDETFFTGSRTFTVKEIEVFEISD
jgi:hypothetical protein